MLHLRSFSRYALLALLIFTLLSGATQTLRAAPNAQGAPYTLRVAMPAPQNLDPTQLSRFDPATRDLVENLFVGLTRFDPTTHQIEPMLATDWQVSADGLRWTFTLRDDVYWVRYDAETRESVAVRPVVAGDFVYAIQRACNPKRPSPLSNNLMPIKGCYMVAHAFPQTLTDLYIAQEIGARALGPQTLEIELLYPASYFPALLSTPELRPLPRELFVAGEQITRGSALLSNGPFVLTRWDAAGMSLARNPHWPLVFGGNIEAVEVRFAESAEALARAVADGRADMARLLPEQVEIAQQIAGDRVRMAEGDTLTMLGFSFDRTPTDRALVRRALAWALDREALARQFFPSEALAAVRFTAEDVVAAPDSAPLRYDPAAAQAAFAEVGFPACTSVPDKFVIALPENDPRWEQVGTALVEQWSTTLGCNPALFEITTVPHPLLIQLGHANYDTETVVRPHLWLFTWTGDYPDANAWLGDALHCRYGYIRNARACDETDAWLDRAGQEMDTAQRAALYGQAEEAFFGEKGSFPVIPLFRSVSVWGQAPNLDGVSPSAARYDRWQWTGTE